MDSQQNYQLFFNTWYDLNTEYRNELMRQAARERLARLAQAANRSNLYRTVMAWTGRRMMAAGRSLMAMAENATSETPIAHAEHFRN